MPISGCVGFDAININEGCLGNVVPPLEISFNGGNTYQAAGEGPWFFENSLQNDSEIRVRATIRKPGCPDRYITGSFYPDEECLLNGLGLVWDVDNFDEIKIPIDSNYSYNYNVNWGDGTYETGITGEASHSFLTEGQYVVKISGTFPKIFFGKIGFDQMIREKLVQISQWGNIEWQDFSSAFINCSFLTITATDTPNLSNVTALNNTFNGCSSLTTIPNINTWDVSNVTNLNATFAGTQFNSNIGDWNVSNVEEMQFTFFNCPFNNGGSNSIKDWDTSKTFAMGYMFSENPSFNQPLTNWNTSKVIDFTNMFFDASSFNQDVSNFSIQSITTGSSATPSGRSDSLYAMFENSGLNSTNYSNILIAFSSSAASTNRRFINFGAAPTQYTSNATASRNSLINDLGWSIIDGGLV